MSKKSLPWFDAPAGKAGACPPLYLAPMAGFTDIAFRELCKQHGADVAVTEFVQAIPLVRGVARTWETIEFTESQRPAGVQVFGADPAMMAEAARLIEARLRPDFIDINYGCPAHKVVEQNAGSSLLRCPKLLEAIAHAVVRAVPATPVTAKMRIGWDAQNIVAVETARRLEDAGARAIAVHGRTRAQGYSGEADWAEIARVAAAVRVPVIGNGDIRDGAGAVCRFRESGVSGLMIGRAALGNPGLFSEIKFFFENGFAPPPPSAAECRAMLLSYAENVLRNAAGGIAGDAAWMLTKLHPFTHRLPGARKLRAGLSRCRTFADIEALLAGDAP